MTRMSIIGAGTMGTAIGRLAVRAGVSVQLIAPDAAEAVSTAAEVGGVAGGPEDALTGDIVVLAVPHTAVDDLIARYGPQLAGKIVVDITNPIEPKTSDGLSVPGDSSSAQLIAAAVPGARVLKAFNTTFAGTLNQGQIGGHTTTVLVAGDDQEAKNLLLQIVRGAGLAAVDVGSLRRARELEALGFLEIKLAATGAITWTGGFALIT